MFHLKSIGFIACEHNYIRIFVPALIAGYAYAIADGR